MKILFSGYHNSQFMTITEYIEEAIKALGHDLVVFDDREHIIPGRIRRRVTWLDKADVSHINRNMLSIAVREKPKIAIITGGHRIAGSTIEELKELGVLTVLWTIDPPLDFDPVIKAAPLYDHIFCQGTEAIELLDRAGIKGAKWLPMGCDPEQHRPVELSDEEKGHYANDIVFVGSYYPERAHLFERLTGFDFGIWGPGWEQLDKKSSLGGHIRGAHTKPSDWVKIYGATKIVLATHYHGLGNSFPVYQASPRIFEAMACGAFVISDDQKDVFSLFKEGEHLVRFTDSDDLVAKVIYYLDHALEREEVARQGRTEVINNHTYVQRIEKLLSIANQTKQGNVQEESPAHR